ncbi:uncharacterized protein LOC110975147 isoform X3 [Acanthaster planci]|uniref:Uncharacterized protein LOC110975147 isoform X3 n=1 Tax=Acanthaster planci TaxID=133434 RepID=A0A8B7XQB7_ACAPL|nr:uncharacterized protein LOC110975147 isoform X3 [Acanthaster planci]
MSASAKGEAMEERDSPPGKEDGDGKDDRGPRPLLTAACRVTEMDEGTAVYISSSATQLGQADKDSSMDIAPSLITLYDKYASTNSELMSITESTAAKTESPESSSKDDIIPSKTGTSEITDPETETDSMAVDTTDVTDGVVSTCDAPMVHIDEPADMTEKPEELNVMPNPPNQSFLYKSLSSLKPDVVTEEKDATDTDVQSKKRRSESCPGILDGDNEPSTNATVETEIECTTAAPTESKLKTSNVEFKTSGSDLRSASLDKSAHPPKRKTSATSPPERTDTNANLKSFQRTLSFGARLARTKFSQFIESNALGKSKHEAASNKKTSEAPTVKPRTRLRSDSEPAPLSVSAIKLDHKRKSSRLNPAISSTAEIDDALSPTASPLSTPPPRLKSQQSSRHSFSYMDQKCKELLDTEESYVMDLEDVIQGYKEPIAATINFITLEDQDTLFGNIQEIHDFNKKLLKELQQCNNDPVLIAECFLDNEKNFRVYTDYCTNYPDTMEVLIDCTKYDDVAEFFRECQLYLGHPLPLGAYLLKPVQRVLKYHLLFQDMYKHVNKEEEGYEIIGDALVCMTGIARYINEMKRKHEARVHVQEIQSQLVGWEGDLMSSGDLVLEDVFRMQGARAERYLYLFEKVLLIGKKREDGLISIKTHISCSNLMLIESIQKEPLGFNVLPFDNPSIQYTILARSMDQKKLWSHEIKKLILQNFESKIPSNSYELILRSTMSTTTDPNKEVQPDQDLTRDKKERKSKRRQKRRNSEPMGKLIRGQKQVKGMKRPELSRWNGRSSSGDIRVETFNTTDDSDNESLESPHRRSTSRLTDVTPERRSSLSAGSDSTRTPDSRSPNKRPTAGNLSQRLSRNSMELDGSVSSTHSDEEKDRAAERSNLTKKRESNRDSGIGSMTLSEHASTEGDRDANGSSRRGGPDRNKTAEDMVKKADPNEDDNAIEELIENTESPDELEALEALPEIVPNASVGHEDTMDLESLPSFIKKVSPSEPFKVRHSNIKSYRPLNTLKNGDVWLPMSSNSYVRSRSASYGARPLSADVAMHAPLKIPLSRSNSDDRCMLAAVSEMHNRSHSDPNMLDTHTEDRSSSPPRAEPENVSPSPQIDLLDVSPSSLGASGETSSFSSNENLLESVNNAFKRLGEKYSNFHLSDNEGNKSEAVEDSADSVANVCTASAATKLEKDEPESETDKSCQEECQAEPPPVPLPPKTVIKLAREFSRKAKEGPKLVMLRHVFSDPYIDRDGTAHSEGFSIKEDKDGHTVVRPKTPGKVTSKIETFQRAMTENESWEAPARSRVRHISDSLFHATPVRATSSSSDEEKTTCQDSTPSSQSRNGRNRQSVRDAVRNFEKPSPLKPESKVVTPVSLGIKQRLQAIQQNAEFHKQTQDELRSAKIKSLRERRQELQEWVSRPIPRKYTISETGILEMAFSDTASHCSDEPDGMSSYASSLQSSAQASPVHVARGALSLAGSETSSEPSPQDSEPVPFRSLKERFQELEKAVSKPVPRTCINPKDEIEAQKQTKVVEECLPLQYSLKEEELNEGTKSYEEDVDEEATEEAAVITEEVVKAEMEIDEVKPQEVTREELVREDMQPEDKQPDVDNQRSSPQPDSRPPSSPVFLTAQSSEGLHRATSSESNYTDARSEFSTQDSSEESFHSGYATPTES